MIIDTHITKVAFLTIAIYLHVSSFIYGQLDRQVWFIGEERSNSGMIFENNVLEPIPSNIKGRIDLSENSVMLANASVVNFYSNGETIINELSQPMPNGRSLKGSPRSMYGTALAENPSACNQFYLFYTESTDDGPNRRLYYSIIDLTIEVEDFIFTARGDVIPTQKDIDITPTSVDIGESLYILDKEIPKEGAWLFGSNRTNNSIIIFNLSTSGVTVHREYRLENIFIDFPLQNISTIMYDSYTTKKNEVIMSLSPGNEEVISNFPIGSLSFDRRTGELIIDSYIQIANSTSFTYGTAFSSDGSKFYYSDHLAKTLHQYDFSSGITTLISTSSHDGRTGGLKRGINGKIYWANQFSINPPGTRINTLSVVEEPNQEGLRCNLAINAYDIGTSSNPERIGVFPSILAEALPPKAIIISQASCGRSDGSAGVLVDPRMEPLTYDWSNGSTDRILSKVDKGLYIVEMMSLDGCTFIDSVEISQIVEFPITDIILSYMDPTDCNTRDGIIIINSPDFIINTPFDIKFKDDIGNEFNEELVANERNQLILSDLSMGSYFDFSISRLGEECQAEVDDTISLIGLGVIPDLGNDTLLCKGETYLISPDGPYTSYLWSDGSRSSSLIVRETGVYALEVEDDLGCTGTSTVYVQFVEKPSISLDRSIEIEIGDSTVLMPDISTTDSLSYTWLPPEGLSCSDCLSPTARPVVDQEYLFEVFNESNCSDSASVMITINNKTGLFFPNSFSPNGDGRNDIFEYSVSSEVVVSIKSFQIFNRWGERVYRRENISIDERNFGWNGNYQGDEAKTGIYVYSVLVELSNGQLVQGQGDVLIVR